MKKFLTAFPALAAAFASNAGVAPVAAQSHVQSHEAVAAPQAAGNPEGRITAKDDAGNLLNFVLRRSDETGLMMAWHESHASHASHSSHSSHSSHYSSRY